MKADFAELETRLRSEMASKADLAETERRIRAVVEFHSSVVGHGALIGEPDERIGRVEKHLNLPPLPPH